MPAPYSVAPGPVKILDALSTGTSSVFMMRGAVARATLYFQSSAQLTTGVISIEEAFWEPLPSQGGIGADNGIPYTGAWSVIQTVTGTAFATGSQLAVHVQGSAWAVRARITTAVAGGTLTAWAYGN